MFVSNKQHCVVKIFPLGVHITVYPLSNVVPPVRIHCHSYWLFAEVILHIFTCCRFVNITGNFILSFFFLVTLLISNIRIFLTFLKSLLFGIFETIDHPASVTSPGSCYTVHLFLLRYMKSFPRCFVCFID